MQDILKQIQSELRRVGAGEVQVQLDEEFEPAAGTLIKVQMAEESAYWHLLPGEFLDLLKELPADAGGEGVKTAIGTKGANVWRGPAPKNSRDGDSQS